MPPSRAGLPIALALAAVIAGWPWDTLAEPDDAATKAACVASHVQAQELRQRGALLSATRALEACSVEACPALVRKDCVAWAESWQDAIPTVVVEVHDAKGDEVSDVRLYVDGTLVASSLDGRAIRLDPGAHELRAILPDATEQKTKLLLREGEQRRRVVLGSPPASETPLGAPPRRYEPAIWGPLAAVAGVGTVLFAAMGGVGKAKESELDACAPRCVAEDVDEMRRYYLVADISLGVAAAGAAATALYFAIASAVGAPDESPPASVYVAPTLGGAAFGLRLTVPGL
ncbi:MAG: hypothetical protein JNL21_38770 [Myxococcales bacterium]|nr:hypothetical protein [Myxococcales bacterium]